MKRITPVNLFIFLASVWLPVQSALCGSGGAASAVIQATARVVPSLGLAAASDERPTADNSDAVDLSLWMTESDKLQVQVTADGRPMNFRLTADESATLPLPVLERHRRTGQTRQILQIDPLPISADTCTITIVDPTN